MTKNELIEFITYIRKTPEVLIDRKVIRFPLSGSRDMTGKTYKIVDCLKTSATVDDAYNSISRLMTNQLSCLYKEYPQICYKEDLFDYLIAQGIDMVESERMTNMIANGSYKVHYRDKPHPDFGAQFHAYAKSIHQLIPRDNITLYLKSEFRLFSLRKELIEQPPESVNFYIRYEGVCLYRYQDNHYVNHALNKFGKRG